MVPFSSLLAHQKVFRILVKRDLRVRYARSILGYLWTVIDPMANALVYFMLFVVIFQRKDAGYHPYFLFLLTGLLPWQWFNATVNESTRALLLEVKLIKSTNLPRQIWVIRMVTSKMIEFVFSLPVLVIFVIIYTITGDTHVDWELGYFLLAIALQFVLLVGIGLILAPLTVLVQDVVPLVRIATRILFYLTPIIYGLNLPPAWLRHLFYLNPMTGIMELFRAGFFSNVQHTSWVSLNWIPVYFSLGITALTLTVGIALFKRLEKPMLKEI